MPCLCKQVECQTLLYTTRTTPTLLGDIRLDQPGYLPLFIVAHLAMFARINDTGDIGDGHTRFGNVCR
jgi:hypothetical protein